MLEKLKAARERLAHELAHPLTFGETLAHGAYFGSLFFGAHEFYVACGGVLLIVIGVRLLLGLLE